MFVIFEILRHTFSFCKMFAIVCSHNLFFLNVISILSLYNFGDDYYAGYTHPMKISDYWRVRRTISGIPSF